VRNITLQIDRHEIYMFALIPKSGLDERVRLLVFLSYVSWLVLLRGFPMLGVVVGGMCLLLLLLSPAPGALFGKWARTIPAALIVVILYWIFAPPGGEVWFSLFGKPFGPDGLRTGTFFASRFLGFLLGGFYLYESSSPERMARGLLWFFAPLRKVGIPVHVLYYIIWFAMRSVPVLTEEAQTTRLAQRARGARLYGNPRERLQAALSLMVPVFASAVRRSDRFALSLQARGFDPTTHYQRHSIPSPTITDYLWLAGLAVAWILFILWRWRI
jgi:energy-coupling factor transport system permease protein